MDMSRDEQSGIRPRPLRETVESEYYQSLGELDIVVQNEVSGLGIYSSPN